MKRSRSPASQPPQARAVLSALGVAIALSTTATALAAEPDAANLHARASALLQPVPDTAPGSESDTIERIELGRRLYFETALSLDDSQSCNSCHRIDGGRAGVDNLPTSPGVKGTNGERNSPTVLNAALHIAQFWDGRAPDLAEQAQGPVLNPVEMAMPDETTVLTRLLARPVYVEAFAGAFPGQADAVTYDNLATAIAAFERTLLTHDRFDEFLRGDLAALTSTELSGLQGFLDAGCAACHNGPALGGQAFMKLGLVKPYTDSKDPGRAAVTGEDADRQVFKVPGLRNITLTAPYFHNGGVATLDEAVRRMGEYQLGRDLSTADIEAIVGFLGALEGTRPVGAPGP